MLWHSTTNMNIAMWMHALLAAKMSLYRVKIRWSLVKYQVRRVTPEITRIEIDFFAQMGKNWVKIGISNGISQQVSEPSSRNFKLWWIYVCELIWHNFRVSPRDVAMVTNYYYFFFGGGSFCRRRNSPPSLVALAFRNGIQRRLMYARINSSTMPVHRVKIWWTSVQ